MATEKPKTDTVMMFKLNGQPVNAECTLGVESKDDLMKGFKAASNGADPNFFEVHEFDFGMSLKEGDTKEVMSDTGAFAKWRSATQDEYKEIVYPLEFDKFTFKRTMDKASPIFFANCCASTSFDSAVVVKRMAQGHDRPVVGFMRVEFTTVMLTGIDWSDGELVSESIDFICQKMTITLRGQTTAGIVSAAKEYTMTWDPSTEGDRSKGIRTKYAPTTGG
jgi:type VI protein secretion system component Hcp